MATQQQISEAITNAVAALATAAAHTEAGAQEVLGYAQAAKALADAHSALSLTLY